MEISNLSGGVKNLSFVSFFLFRMKLFKSGSTDFPYRCGLDALGSWAFIWTSFPYLRQAGKGTYWCDKNCLKITKTTFTLLYQMALTFLFFVVDLQWISWAALYQPLCSSTFNHRISGRLITYGWGTLGLISGSYSQPLNSWTRFVILLTVNHTILIMLVQRI